MFIYPHSTTVTSHRELARLIDFAKASAVPGGFGFLDRFGAVEKGRSPACFVTARMTYCFSTASLLGMPDVEGYASHGVASLSGAFRDEAFGGYVSSLDGTPAAQRKRAYDTCFVALAASSAATAGIPGGESLTEHVSDVLRARFWSNEAGALFESWDREFAEPEPYWGANANMHGLEALLALYGYTRNTEWRELGLRIAETFINTRARSANWWLNEHYGPDWTPMPEFNADNPRHEFHPYGMTPGHLFEWSRLLLQLESTFEQPPAWLREAAAGLYETAAKHGWAADGKAGFVYTVDWNGQPVIRDRPHWVTAEAISAAATWTRLTGGAPRYANDLREWANFAQMHFVDTEHGSWHPLLDPNNRPSYTMWSGKPDIYHALQAVLLPQMPVAESTARAIMTAGNGS
ncbi:AGE family epimerase/isomerase [Arthrobacter globiformis]|uniref:AGE family epimerase/isomerase n=1 Tax=Arthrobacter globiformis TaxID=1665 RepID=UPI00167D9498|nr:AGE family epimerase/isomerase [Arthrobacter globiformis]